MPLDAKDLDKVKALLDKNINFNSLFLPTTNSDEEYVVRSQKKRPKHNMPPFVAHRGGKYMRDRSKSLLHIIGKMNAAERWFFLYVDNLVDFDTNIAVVKNSKLTNTQIGYKTKAYKSLHNSGLIKRIKREHYMINPDMVIPLETYPIVKTMWNSI